MGGDASSLKFKSILPRWQSADLARTRLKPVSSFTAAPAAGKGKSSAGKDLEKGNGNHPPSADKSFYENLPFHGLKSPPKQVNFVKRRQKVAFHLNTQVLNPKLDDHLDYADADYKDLYAEGPVGYKAASKQAKEGKRLWIVILVRRHNFILWKNVFSFPICMFSMWTISGLIKECYTTLRVGSQSISLCDFTQSFRK